MFCVQATTVPPDSTAQQLRLRRLRAMFFSLQVASQALRGVRSRNDRLGWASRERVTGRKDEEPSCAMRKGILGDLGLDWNDRSTRDSHAIAFSRCLFRPPARTGGGSTLGLQKFVYAALA